MQHSRTNTVKQSGRQKQLMLGMQTCSSAAGQNVSETSGCYMRNSK
jgi:hypothetical protein